MAQTTATSLANVRLSERASGGIGEYGAGRGMHGGRVDYAQWMQQLNGQPLLDRTRYRQHGDEYDDYEFDAQCRWEPLPVAWYNEYQLIGSDLNSMEWNRNWTLAYGDQGAFTFRVENLGGGLVIGLSNVNSDIFGYHIVLDDDDGTSYVLRMVDPGRHGLAQQGYAMPRYRKLAGVRYDQSFHFTPDEPIHLWVMYNYGRMQVGIGTVPGEGRLLLEAHDPQAAPNIHQFGFGRMGRRWPHKVWVKDVVSYRFRVPDVHKHAYASDRDNDRFYEQCWRSHLYPR